MENGQQLLWVAGHVFESTEDCNVTQWDLKGVYTSKALAQDQCKKEGDFIAPIACNAPSSDDAELFESEFYPFEN